MQAVLNDFLYPVRDKVLDHADLHEGDVLLDVGCGDGLIAFGALQRLKTLKVIFSDISQDLLDHARSLAAEMQLLERSEFMSLAAEDLSAIQSVSVDVVTTRSVLIYLADKLKAFDEFFRVLRPGGRLSIFEPINRFAFPERPHLFGGYDVTPIIDLADKVKAVFLRLQPPDADPMTDFDERDFIALAERAGFQEVHLELQVEVKPHGEHSSDWEAFINSAGNPKIPSIGEAIPQALSPDEAERFIAHLRPLVESRRGTRRSAVAYLWATK